MVMQFVGGKKCGRPPPKSDMIVSRLITTAFQEAASQYPDIHHKWVAISQRIGALLPESLLIVSVQRSGRLDVVLRCMEDDFAPQSGGTGSIDALSVEYQAMLSDIWIGVAYEIFRLLIGERKLVVASDELMAIAHDLRMLRIPLEKHEIAGDKKLPETLLMQKSFAASDGVESEHYFYRKSDAQKSHIMPSAISPRGSLMWHAIDLQAERSYWLERRAISDRIIGLW